MEIYRFKRACMKSAEITFSIAIVQLLLSNADLVGLCLFRFRGNSTKKKSMAIETHTGRWRLTATAVALG